MIPEGNLSTLCYKFGHPLESYEKELVFSCIRITRKMDVEEFLEVENNEEKNFEKNEKDEKFEMNEKPKVDEKLDNEDNEQAVS